MQKAFPLHLARRIWLRRKFSSSPRAPGIASHSQSMQRKKSYRGSPSRAMRSPSILCGSRQRLNLKNRNRLSRSRDASAEEQEAFIKADTDYKTAAVAFPEAEKKFQDEMKQACGRSDFPPPIDEPIQRRSIPAGPTIMISVRCPPGESVCSLSNPGPAAFGPSELRTQRRASLRHTLCSSRCPNPQCTGTRNHCF